MNKENVITLDNPVKRGEQVIEQVTLMKPNAGTLRGVSLAAVANSEVDALIKVLPRMTAPMLTGGKLTMTTLRLMAEEGRAWPLLDGTGMIYGMYVISRVSETGSIFFADGTPRKIDFTLSLTRVDESLAALYGDIGKQAESLIGKAGSVATRFTGMTGAG